MKKKFLANSVGIIAMCLVMVPGMTTYRINEIFIEAFGKDVYKEDMVACSYVARKIIDNLFI